MTPAAFKSWFNGFLDGVGSTSNLTPGQWSKIKEQVAAMEVYPPFSNLQYPPGAKGIGTMDGHSLQGDVLTS